MSEKSDQRNPGIPLDLDWVDAVLVNRSAVERRCSSLTKRRSIKKEWQAAWLLKAIRCMDLTTLSSDDTPDRVRRLCSKALRPLKQELTNDLGITSLNLTVGAVCVYQALVETVAKALKGSNIPVAAVSTGFPHGLSPLPRRIGEIRDSVSAGALEIDIVITRAHVFSAN